MSKLYNRIGQKIDEDLAIIEAQTLMESGDKAFKTIAYVAGGALSLVALIFWIPSLLHFCTTLAKEGPIPWVRDALSVDIGKWGQFGDFFGGLLNPAVGIATIYLILINVRLQKRELSLALQEMKNSNESLKIQNQAINIQNFQSTFFNWLNSYHQIISAAKFSSHQDVITGAPALRLKYKVEFSSSELADQFNRAGMYAEFPHFDRFEQVFNEENCGAIENIILVRWVELRSNHYVVDSSVKSLLGLIEWIIKLAPDSKTRAEYLDILSSQLSHIELAFVLFETSATNKSLRRDLQLYKFFEKFTTFDDPSIWFIRLRSEIPDQI